MPKPYNIQKSSSRLNYTQTCTHVGGCTQYPSLVQVPYHEATLSSVSTNNKRNRKVWSTYSLTKNVAYGANNLQTWYAKYVWSVWNPSTGGYTNYSSPYVNQVQFSRMMYASNWATPSSRAFAEADAIAQAKLFSRLKDARTQWNAAVALGEARETAAHILSVATRIFKAYKALKKGRLGDVYNSLLGNPRPPASKLGLDRRTRAAMKRPDWKDNVASSWMEYSYAWIPLLGDIDSAARYFAEKMVGKTYRVYSVTARHQLEANWTGVSQYTAQGGPERVREISSVRYTYELEPDWLRKPSTLDELGFTDPVSVAWELLPLSFVVDWFVNVGQVLESLTEFRRWTVRRGLKSQATTFFRFAQGSAGAVSAGGFTITDWDYPSCYLRQKSVARTPIQNLPVAVPLKINVSNPFDLKAGQMASALALLRYAFR